MNSVAFDVVVGGSALAVSLLLLLKRRRKPEPPSVGRYPIVGSLLHLPEPWYLSLYERYGHHPIVTVQMGTKKVYIFNQWEPFREAMLENAEQLTGRANKALREYIFGEVGGIIGSDGYVWREYRRFSLHVLRDFGFGRKGGEEMVVAEAEHLCRAIEEAEGAALDTAKLMSEASSNIICQLVFGSRLASEDPRFSELLEMFQNITQNDGTRIVLCFMVSLNSISRYFSFLLAPIARTPRARLLFQAFSGLFKFCNEHRDRRSRDMDAVHKARDYIEAHLMHQKANPSVFNDTRLSEAVIDLFLAGTDTTANTLRWAILFMIDNPDVADATHREIADSIGLERLPEMKDRQRLPYTQAVIEEVLRRSSLVPLGLLHRVTEKVTVGGYELEKDTVCAFNVYSINHDPKFYPNPTEFRPTRHLRDGQFVPLEQQSAFGIGKRACLGESLARVELFIFFASLMQRFQFSLDPNDSKTVWDLTEDPKLFHGSILRVPPAHKIAFTAR